MSKAKLDQEEKELLKAYEAGEFESVLTPARKNQIREAASSTFKKDGYTADDLTPRSG